MDVQHEEKKAHLPSRKKLILEPVRWPFQTVDSSYLPPWDVQPATSIQAMQAVQANGSWWGRLPPVQSQVEPRISSVAYR